MKIILFRHLVTEYVRDGRLCGQSDPDLLPESRLELSEEIRKLIDSRRPNVYVSPLRRCGSTAEQLSAMCDCGKQVTISGLMERNWGPLQGYTKARIADSYGQGPGELRNSLPGIERDREFRERVLMAYEQILGREPEDTVVVIVTHQGCIRILHEFWGLDFVKFAPGEGRIIDISSLSENGGQDERFS